MRALTYGTEYPHPSEMEASTTIGRLGTVLMKMTLGDICIWNPMAASIIGNLVSKSASYKGSGLTVSKNFCMSKKLPQTFKPFLTATSAYKALSAAATKALDPLHCASCGFSNLFSQSLMIFS